ncbi:acetolactate decarboxylase [Paenibacillus shenyangensis]|uniref:acetolactate decarboxylase n=1 Tax=Paenibacillus sp. A9 TaxID=1284352 RepID=UPI000378496D|nr:acetolactate decarboxylase [Paenibacillus sp. A9]
MKNPVVYQASTMVALLSGLYDGAITFGELKQYGDFGIGTFHQLDGEMIAFDGSFYHLYPNGTAKRVLLEESTPFSTVTFFEAQQTHELNRTLNREQLEKVLDELISSPNLFHAIRIEGTFREVHTRTVPHQEKPYKPFVEVTKSQPSFHFTNVKGIIAGFWTPAFAQGIGVAGYHLHFINDARNGGGHVLDFVVENCKITLCSSEQFNLLLPSSETYLQADLATPNLEQDILTAEGSGSSR